MCSSSGLDITGLAVRSANGWLIAQPTRHSAQRSAAVMSSARKPAIAMHRAAADMDLEASPCKQPPCRIADVTLQWAS
jgi:hypothetical protein